MGLGRLAASMTVGQKAALSVAIGLLGFAAAVALTALVVSPKAALAIWSGLRAKGQLKGRDAPRADRVARAVAACAP